MKTTVYGFFSDRLKGNLKLFLLFLLKLSLITYGMTKYNILLFWNFIYRTFFPFDS